MAILDAHNYVRAISPTICAIRHDQRPLRGCASDIPSIRNLCCDRLYICCVSKRARGVLIQPLTLQRCMQSALLLGTPATRLLCSCLLNISGDKVNIHPLVRQRQAAARRVGQVHPVLKAKPGYLYCHISPTTQRSNLRCDKGHH